MTAIRPETRVGRRLYATFATAQGGVCAICRRPPDETRRLAIDHEHWSGRVRGLLCTRCNLALGYLRDDPEVARRAVDYLLGRPVDGERRCIDCGKSNPVPVIPRLERFGATRLIDHLSLSCCRFTPLPLGHAVVTEVIQ